MRLGTRWEVGALPPASLPTSMVDAIRQVESELAQSGAANVTGNWQLTWLEGRPVLDLDDGTRITCHSADSTVAITRPGLSTDNEDDDW
ncbi:hypothetical protein [Rathayibacter toxicus]|uniref:hypothetical protein n=1 Tax=Rathayibacter toxicus TaxID=145458 RepID=UPI000CE79D0E|nr:hypothetical protein [Rathayibacter toxicus]PPI55242.1 hypothetical protein C5D35_05880 [Rathayibacter toxicus]QOD09506.1 hypothetical protein BSG36_05790 [Rathayibacter toxicus]QWL28174.1 hypothetical protein E2R33_05795 [Rathayibacter toxicus]QWL32370.1 hypothetical protein E2R35_05665 [Rathayibacter toxicus]QWL34464.1 hypothetical protein E2R36_05670 [Rathayibacter toxicus]